MVEHLVPAVQQKGHSLIRGPKGVNPKRLSCDGQFQLLFRSDKNRPLLIPLRHIPLLNIAGQDERKIPIPLPHLKDIRRKMIPVAVAGKNRHWLVHSCLRQLPRIVVKQQVIPGQLRQKTAMMNIGDLHIIPPVPAYLKVCRIWDRR